MASEWQTVCIEDIAERIAMGPFGSSIKVETFVSDGIPIINGQHLHGFKIDDAAGYNFITEEHADRLKKASVRRGDLVFTHRGNVGQVALIPETSTYDRYVVSQSQFYLRCDRNKVIPEYLVAYFKSREGQHKLLANSTSVGVPSIAQPVTYLRSIEIQLPPLNEQRAIAHILGTLDDKIELNRNMNETLEAMARAIFKAWFVDFEPVRAKIEGRWQRGKSLPGLPAHLYDLFPERLVGSELGEIPEGWEISVVGDEFNLTMGQSPPGETYNGIGEGLPFYQGRADFGFRYPTRRIYCTAPTRIAQAGDTLISVRAPVGDINMASEECAIGRGVASVRHKSGSSSYSFQFMQGLEEIFERFEAEGTVFGSIGKKDFHSIPCVRPPVNIIGCFEEIIRPLDNRFEVAEFESRLLATLRDALLPKLIRGEFRATRME